MLTVETAAQLLCEPNAGADVLDVVMVQTVMHEC